MWLLIPSYQMIKNSIYSNISKNYNYFISTICKFDFIVFFSQSKLILKKYILL